MDLVAEELSKLIGNGLWLDMRSCSEYTFDHGQLHLHVQLHPNRMAGTNELKVMIFHDWQEDPSVNWQIWDLLIPPMFGLVAWGYSQFPMTPVEWSRDQDQGFYYFAFRQEWRNGVAFTPEIFSGEYILYQVERRLEFPKPVRHLRLVG